MGICALTVGINFNMMDYLPEDANSTVAIAVMKENFSEGISNANVMVPNVNINQAIEYKEKISQLPGIKDVMWLDDVADLKQPLIAIDKDTVETYYKDNAALFAVTIEDGAFKAIFGSAATTFFGFVALLFMEFKIGPNMGVALVRGVVVSYITIMVFLPALILCVYKKIDKTKHRSFLPDFTKAGNALVKGRIPVFLIVLLLLFPAYQAQKNNSFLYGTGEASMESRLGID